MFQSQTHVTLPIVLRTLRAERRRRPTHPSPLIEGLSA
jgi:hypothetical protein